jgi:diguanylate cyclase (GGDEF)-like protein/PAS domain S-box-containing protein
MKRAIYIDCLGRDGELAAAVLNGLLDGIILVNMDGEVVYVNSAFEKMLGYRAEELVGRPALELPTYRGKKENSDKAALTFKQVIQKGFAAPIDMPALTKDGKVIPLSFTASVIKDTDGNLRTFVAVVRDITERKKIEEALHQSEQVSKAMLEIAETGIYLLHDGCFQYVNHVFEAISGYSSDELKGKHSLDYIFPDDRDEVRNKAIEALKGQSHLPYQFRLIRKDGELAWVLDRLASIQYNGKRSVLGTLTDISEMKRAEAQILEYTKQLEALFNIGVAASRTLDIGELLDSVLDKVLNVMELKAGGIFLFDQQTNELVLKAYRGASKRFVKKVEQMVLSEGFSALVAISGKPLLIPDVESDSRLRRIGIKSEGIQSFAAVPIMAKEQVLGIMAVGGHSVRQFPPSATYLLSTIASQIGMAIDNARLYERALQLAFTDSLTGLYNRRYLLDQLDRELARAKRNQSSLSLVMMDVDALKAINDRFGHNEGDIVLKELGSILKINTRASDIAARWGGDEFVLLTSDTDSKGSHRIGERIRSQVEHCRPMISGKETSISISVGIASYPENASGVTELLKRADEAMYNAKGLGKNQVCVFCNGKSEHTHV